MEAPVTPLSTVLTTIRVFLASVFVIAGIPKLIVANDLSTTLRAIGFVRPAIVTALRFAVPIAETAVGCWLLASWHPAAASFTAATMLTGFTYILFLLRQRDASGCGCFVWDNGKISVVHVIRNMFLGTVAIVTGIVTLLGRYTWEAVWKLPAQPALLVAASVIFAFLIYAIIATSWQFARNAFANS